MLTQHPALDPNATVWILIAPNPSLPEYRQGAVVAGKPAKHIPPNNPSAAGILAWVDKADAVTQQLYFIRQQRKVTVVVDAVLHELTEQYDPVYIELGNHRWRIDQGGNT